LDRNESSINFKALAVPTDQTHALQTLRGQMTNLEWRLAGVELKREDILVAAAALLPGPTRWKADALPLDRNRLWAEVRQRFNVILSSAIGFSTPSSEFEAKNGMRRESVRG
jgi:hypothetical protein